jgi:electron transfer flavoprotein alpha/beta subunit
MVDGPPRPRVRRRVKVTARSTLASRTGLDGRVNCVLVMRNEREDLVAVGPVSIGYQVAMIGDEFEERAGWTTVGIARVLTVKQARTIAVARGG